MKTQKVVLFQGRASSFGKRITLAPLALLQVSSFLRQDGFEVKIISDTLFDDYINEAVKECRDAICLGITAMTGSQISEGLKVASLVKEQYPALPIVWGGWHPSILPESTLTDPRADIVVIGQGERRFYRIVKYLASSENDKLADISGISFKQEGHIVVTSPAEVEDMNNFPRPEYGIIDIERCLNKTEYGDRTLQYISSYGCPFRCSFCVEPVVSKRRWVALSAGRVVDEWAYLHKTYGIDSIAVYDSNFFVDKKRVIDICEGIIRSGLKIKWGNVNGRIPQLVKFEKPVWELMERAGLKMILTGSESGEQEVLDLINKDADLKDIYEFTRLCRRHNIKILFSYMSGIPWSGDPAYNSRRVDQEINSILAQADELLKISKRNRFMIYAYTPLPGSSMYEMALSHGFKEPKILSEWSELLYSPEDVFENAGCKQKWISERQMKLITMLEQYIFGMMDIDARDWIAKGIGNRALRLFFKVAFNIGHALARLRLRLRAFYLPVDYWLFVKFRKKMGVF